MGVIWYAVGIYIVGIAIVLYIRPTIMFQPGGTWKEFGISKRDEYSVLPFWLFTVVWAIFSYALGTLVSTGIASIVLASSPATETSSNTDFLKPISSMPNVSPNMPSLSTPAPPRVPGYYVLESAVPSQPRYVYWGTEPPRF